MNKFNTDENLDHQSDENPDESRHCLSDDDSDDAYSLDSNSAENQLYGRGGCREIFSRRLFPPLSLLSFVDVPTGEASRQRN